MDLSQEQHGWLSRDLSALEDLAVPAAAYVATGQGEEVLAELAGRTKCGKALRLGSCQSRFEVPRPAERRSLLESFTAGQAAAALRLARVYEAASRLNGRALSLKALGIPDWLEVFLVEATEVTPGVPVQQTTRSRVKAEVLEEMLAAAGFSRDRIVRARLFGDARDYGSAWALGVLTSIPGWAATLARHPGVVREALARKQAMFRETVLRLMVESEADLEPFRDLIAPLADSSSKRVRALARTLLGHAEETTDAPQEGGFEFPPVPPVDLDAPLTPEVREAITEILPSQRQIDLVCRMIETMSWKDHAPEEARIRWAGEEFRRVFSQPGLSLTQAVRLLFLINQAALKSWEIWTVNKWLGVFYESHTPRFTLRELGVVAKALALPQERISDLFLSRPEWVRDLWQPDPEDLWPFFAERLESLEKGLVAQPTWAVDHRSNVLEILALFPRLPARLAPQVWDLALHGPKPLKPLAQACLEREPDRTAKLLEALAASKAETRAAAAEWLGRTGDAAVIPPLRTALAKEKQEHAAGMMMVALERLGVPPSEVADVEGLLAQARKGLAKGIPAGLSWFGWETLPRVRWREGGEPVDRDLLRWLVVQSHKLGTPEPGPRLRHLATLFRPEDGAALGQYVLDSWIGQDTIGHTPEEAHAYADPAAHQFVRWSQTSPEYITPRSYEEWYQRLYNAKLMEPRGSAIKEKGILAIAGACCGAPAAAAVERYLKRYYGTRAAHCKALLQMLSWVDERAAIQVLLATSARFRTASIRKEAERLVQVLAERKGWTVEQLADRTIPTGGFDERCEMTLDYGGRTFTARLGEDWSIVLTNEEGKTIKALPDPRQDDDAEKAKEAKAALAAGRKEIQAILRLQKERLYEALCVQRSWPFEDWRDLLLGHPIVRRYCERLAWSVWDGEALTATFRPLEDGSLTDAEDGTVTVEPTATVRLAHSVTLPPEAAEAWRRHLADYGVQPLFEQLGAAWTLPPELLRETELADFRGHLLESFALRGRATKLGYTRGPAEDSAIFSRYLKTFPGIGLTAEIEFTGNFLPETNRTVALTALTFRRGMAAVPLGEVPPVLLSECRNDMAAVAAQGTGFDPDWEKKSAL